MQVFLELKGHMKPSMQKVLLADLVPPACMHRMTVHFCVFSLCGTAMPLSFYRVHMGRAASFFSMGIHVRK